VANPNNPTGTVAAKKDILKLVRDFPPSVLLVMDEAYQEFLDDAPDLVSLIQDGTRSNLLLMRTFSKIYGLAGLRLGYGLGNEELIDALNKIRQPFNINSIAQAGALAAWEDEEHLFRTRQNNTEGLRFFEEELDRMKAEFIPSVANFLLVRVGNGQRVFEAMQQQGVIVRPMGGYQLPEWIRISIGTPRENRRALEALKQALKTVSQAA
jgi:histidinol-phosphate aminotransferase